jgi:endoglucanase
MGWVGAESNGLGIQGSWSTRVGTNSSMELRFEAGSVCFSGAAAQVVGELGQQFGVAASLDFCRPDPTTPADASQTLSTCPLSPGLHQNLVGVGFSVDGTLPAVLRAGFREQARVDTPYVVVREVGEVVALFEDALVRNNPAAAFSSPSEVQSFELIIPGNRQAPRPFDFCVRDLAALTGQGWVSKEIPEWALEPGLGQRVELVGVNLAGAEFGQGNLPGVYDMDYAYPSAADVEAFAERGMNLVRLPFRWERLQRALGQELDAVELGRLTEVVNVATSRGLSLILDPHNYARYTRAGVEGVVGDAVEVAAFADFWRRLAEVFGANPSVIFGLVNEPHTMLTETWLGAANAAIAAIRATGASNLVLVPGNQWTGAHSWAATYYGTPNSVAMLGVVDPGNNFAFELHQYLDADSSGTTGTCVSETIGVERMSLVTSWLRDNGYRGLLAEFGGAPNDTCLRGVDQMLTYVEDNADVWLGWAAWAAGPRWGDYMFSVQPLANGKDRPPMFVLKRHLNDGVVVPPP